MIHDEKLNNVEYQQIKRNNLFGLDNKSQFETNNFSIFGFLFAHIQ